jgi:hypothetical protein
MVAKSVHLPGSKFRRLPNPCAATWNSSLDMILCLGALSNNLKISNDLGDHQLRQEIQDLFANTRLDKIDLDKRIQTYTRAFRELNDPKEMAAYAHSPGPEREAHQQQLAERYDIAHRDLLDSLHDNVLAIDRKLEDLLDEVREVLACHFRATSKIHLKPEDELPSPTLDNPKEKILIDFYFENILPQVAQGLPDSSPGTPQKSASLRPPSISVMSSSTSTLGGTSSDTRSAVWLALMFKMCSWLFLHDFNPEDRMIERSEFSNNRLPVYIG